MFSRFYPPNREFPCLTLVGSPNFGERSVKRDLETQLAVLTENRELQKKMHGECERLYKFGLPMEEKRNPAKWVHGFVYFFRSFFWNNLQFYEIFEVEMEWFYTWPKTDSVKTWIQLLSCSKIFKIKFNKRVSFNFKMIQNFSHDQFYEIIYCVF